MRRLARRVLAIALLLSVMLPTLGGAGASCARGDEAARRHAAAGVHDMAGMSHDDDASSGSDCGHLPESPGHGGDGCLLLAHCGAVLVAPDEHVAFAAASAGSRRPPVDDARPHERSLEPDSPPPRG